MIRHMSSSTNNYRRLKGYQVPMEERRSLFPLKYVVNEIQPGYHLSASKILLGLEIDVIVSRK